MSDPGAPVAVDGGVQRFLKGRRLFVAVASAWSVTVLGLFGYVHASTGGISLTNLIGAVLLFLSPIFWLAPVGMLPRAPWSAALAGPLLLFMVPVVLVLSAYAATEALSQAYINRALADSAHSDGRDAYLPLYEDGYRNFMAPVADGLRVSVGGGLLAALLEVLGLYCWTRRMPAPVWSIGLLLTLFGPAVAGILYLFATLFG
jgi:hypothetical protein